MRDKVSPRTEKQAAKEWLSRVRNETKKLDKLLESKRRTFYRAVSPTSPLTEKNYAKSYTPYDIYTSYAHLCLEVDKQRCKLEQTSVEILELIWQVKDNILATLLIEYYIHCHSWNEVAITVGYSYQYTVRRKHPEALREVARLLKL